MTTRTYYMPKNRISVHVINTLVERIGCSIGDIKLVNDTMRVPITCNDVDVKRVERILSIYNMIGD